MSEAHNPTVKAAEQVAERVREGRSGLATQALAAAIGDCLPELPLRFSLLLVRPDERRAGALARALRAGEEVELELAEGPRGHQVTWQGARLGDLSARDSELVADFGEHAALYRPRVLEVLFRPEGALSSLAIELVRPEQRACPDCGAPVGRLSPHTCAPGAATPQVALQDALSEVIALHEERRAARGGTGS